jgi:hypothetical protein
VIELVRKGSVCAEIGVYKGDFTREILRVGEPRELHLLDGWWEVEGETYENEWYGWEGVSDTRAAYREVERIVAEHPECQIHFGDDLETLPTFPDHYFDWVYLDSSHKYEHTKRELALLARKVKPEGIISGHDWWPDPSHEHHGVYRAVNEFCERDWQIVYLDDWNQWAIARAK